MCFLVINVDATFSVDETVWLWQPNEKEHISEPSFLQRNISNRSDNCNGNDNCEESN
jgi:hypothetical protein